MTASIQLPFTDIEGDTRGDFEALAEWLSSDRNLYHLDQANQRTGQIFDARNVLDKPGYIKVRPNILAVDLDTDKGLGIAEAIRKKIPYPCVIVASGTPGHAHVLARIDSQADRKAWAGRIAAEHRADIRRGQNALRPPGNPNPKNGARSEIIGMTAAKALAVLKDQQRPERRTDKGQKATYPELIDRTAPKGQRSERDFAFCIRAIEKGWTKEQAEAMMIEDPDGIGSKYIELGNKGPGYLARTWEKATKAAKGRDTEAIAGAWATFALARTKDHRGELQSVIEALAVMASEAGKLELHASMRTIAERAGIGRQTVQRNLEQLQGRGLIEKVGSGRGPQANVYRLKRESAQNWDTLHPKDERGRVRECPTFERDSQKDALQGRAGQKRIYRAMSGSRPQTVREIAEEVGRKPSTVSANLRQLESAGLVQRVGNGWLRIEDESAFEDAADIRGTAGKSQERRERNQRERIGWTGWLDTNERIKQRANARRCRAEERDGVAA